jgi:hypothetical protein
MSTETKILKGIALAQAGLDAAAGNPDPAAIAKAAIGLALEFVPVEELRDHLEAAAIARAELAAIAVEKARGPLPE